ncbi:PAAR domain-containing protein [Vibrio cholerae]|uniref:PAAR domain-containing protein n=1 Tax=Vibrio cholerae TaxID=666 RepID=UPI00301748C1
MPGAARLGDIGSEHDCFPPTPIIAGSGDVFIDGKPAARLGDAIDCGGTIASASANVLIG